MSDLNRRKSAKFITGLLFVQVSLLLVLVVAIAGHKLEWWGFPVLSGALAVSIGGLFVLGLVAFLLLLWSFFRGASGSRLPLVGVLLLAGLPPLVMFATVGSKTGAPPIHDITTDFKRVPVFQAAASDRQANQNSLTYAGGEVSELQRKHYPNVKTQFIDASPAKVFDAVVQIVNERDWEVLRQDTVQGEVEAVSETALMGFKDDVIIRVTEVDGGSAVDMRSASRVGLGDIGANAARIQSFLSALSARLDTQ